MINKFIRNYIAKRMAGRSDDGIMITLKDPQKVNLNESIMAELLMRNGIDPRAIGSEAELKQILKAIARQEEKIAEAGIRNTESAKVFNIEGQSLDPNKPIIGGTQEGKELSSELSERLRGTNTERIKQKIADRKIESDQPPPGSRGGDEDIAAPVMNVEDAPEGFIDFVRKTDPEAANKLQKTDDEIKAAIEAGNKRYLDKIKKQKEEGTYKRYNPEEGSQLDLEIKEEYQKAIRGESKLFAGKFEGTEDDFRNMLDEMTDDFASGGRVGFFMGSKLPKGLATLRTMLNYMGNKSDKVKNPSDVLKMVNPKSLNAILNDPKLQGKVNIKEGILASDMVKDFQSKMGEDRVQLVRDMLDAAKNIKKSDDRILTYKNEIKERMMKDLNMSEAEADRAATAMSQLAMNITKMPNTPKLTDEGILQLENVLKNMETGGKKKRDLNADGGRIGLKDGLGILSLEDRGFLMEPSGKKIPSYMLEGFQKGPKLSEEQLKKLLKKIKEKDFKKKDPIQLMADGGRIGLKDGMNRRTFLKLLGGAMSIPIIGKIFKPFKIGKKVTQVPIIKTDNVPGKPEWFDQLVNKVILEGDDVTKRFATAERQSIHQKTLDDGSVVRVTEDIDDGAVRVEYESSDNVYEDVVQMQYKKPLPDEGDPKPMAEFTTAESGPVGRADGPDDYSIDIDEVGGTSISDLTSDVSKLKTYATGKKPTLKEFIQSKKRKDKARRITEGGEAEMDAVIERQGEFIENDLVDLDPPEFASGGIARMLGE